MNCRDAIEHHDGNAQENRRDQRKIERFGRERVVIEDEMVQLLPQVLFLSHFRGRGFMFREKRVVSGRPQ
ncbi:MAG: hypothetical protein ACP5R6_06035 [Chlorobaculum sp.]